MPKCTNCGKSIKDFEVEYDEYGDILCPDCYDENCSERLSVYDAALIWRSKGKDEDYMFGYSEEELENA